MSGRVRRIHLSEVKFEFDRKYQYTNANPFVGKPGGIWYGINESWLEWCESEMPQWIRRHVFELDVNPSDIMVIQTLEDFNRFEDKYIYHYDADIKGYPYLIESVDWKEVAKNHAGLEINPYFWEKRLNSKTNWYYGWDMASGVIWDLDAIKDATYITEIKNTEHWRREFLGLRLLTQSTGE